jgi:hypothetical protein
VKFRSGKVDIYRHLVFCAQDARRGKVKYEGPSVDFRCNMQGISSHGLQVHSKLLTVITLIRQMTFNPRCCQDHSVSSCSEDKED